MYKSSYYDLINVVFDVHFKTRRTEVEWRSEIRTYLVAGSLSSSWGEIEVHYAALYKFIIANEEKEKKSYFVFFCFFF